MKTRRFAADTRQHHQQQGHTAYVRQGADLHSSASGLSSQYLSRGSVLVCTHHNEHEDNSSTET